MSTPARSAPRCCAAAPAYARAIVHVDQHAEVQVEPDYKHYARPGETVKPVHQVTNLGNYTDTIFVQVTQVTPAISWQVTPTSFTLTNVAKKGTHYLFVTDVALEGFVYDRYGSVTYGSLDGSTGR